MMKTRVIAAAVLLPLLLLCVLVLPKIVTAVLFALIAALAAYELLYNTGLIQEPRLVVYAMIMAALTSIWSYFGSVYAWALLGILAYVAVLFGEMMHSHIKIRFDMIGICLIAGVLVPYLLTSLVRIHAVRLGRHYIMIPFILAFLSDTGAYFTGRAFGSHKLAPVISPNKTIEGMIGGVLCAMLGMLLYTVLLQFVFQLDVNYSYALLYGSLGSVGAVFGDLCFSVIKRQTGIKDYGNLIPGHGGILDRFDSMVIVGPLSEVLLLLAPVAVRQW